MHAPKHVVRNITSCGWTRIVLIRAAHQSSPKPSTQCFLGTSIRECALRISPTYQHLGKTSTQMVFPVAGGSLEAGLCKSFWLPKRSCSTQPIGRSLAQGHLWHITSLRLQASTSNISIQSQSHLRHPLVKDFHGWLAAKLPDLRIWHIVCLEFSAYLCL
ncbi:beta transducin-like protein [Colletotrichum asianum]